MKSRPKTSKIGGLSYRISYEDDPHIEEVRCMGYCCEESKSIVIDEALDEQSIKYYLCHEVMEQVNMIYGLELSHTQITILGTWFHDYLKNNADLIYYLIEK